MARPKLADIYLPIEIYADHPAMVQRRADFQFEILDDRARAIKSDAIKAGMRYGNFVEVCCAFAVENGVLDYINAVKGYDQRLTSEGLQWYNTETADPAPKGWIKRVNGLFFNARKE